MENYRYIEGVTRSLFTPYDDSCDEKVRNNVIFIQKLLLSYYLHIPYAISLFSFLLIFLIADFYFTSSLVQIETKDSQILYLDFSREKEK